MSKLSTPVAPYGPPSEGIQRLVSSEFVTFFRLGVHHIADLQAYDHILFVAALTAPYAPADWKRLGCLVTAFTLGHSVTLALATLGLVHINAGLVEVLIPTTIVLTSLLAVLSTRGENSAIASRGQTARYAMAGGFGLIHGLGFSTFLRSVLGAEESIVKPLFAFNLGLEAGQLLIVAILLALGLLVEQALGLSRRDWVLLMSGAAGGIAVTMILDRLTTIT